MKTVEDIVEKIETLQEDKPNVVLTDDLIKEFVLDNLEQLVEEIKEYL